MHPNTHRNHGAHRSTTHASVRLSLGVCLAIVLAAVRRPRRPTAHVIPRPPQLRVHDGGHVDVDFVDARLLDDGLTHVAVIC